MSKRHDIRFGGMSNDFLILAKPITVTVDANQTKVYGQPDPVFTYAITSGALEPGDAFAGALDRISGEDVANYAIGQGTLSTNYEFSYISGQLTVAKAIATISLSDLEQEVDGSSKSPTVSTAPENLNYTIT